MFLRLAKRTNLGPSQWCAFALYYKKLSLVVTAVIASNFWLRGLKVKEFKLAARAYAFVLQ